MPETRGVFVALTSNVRRRDALKAMAAGAALPLLADACVAPDGTASSTGGADGVAGGGAAGSLAGGKGPRGTPSDPVLIHAKVTWDKRLSAAELTTLAVLCDMIIPADERSPAASKVGVPDYINEHVSAPTRANDLVKVRGGIAWLNAESVSRSGKLFHEASEVERTAICDDICYVPNAKPGYVAGAMFFDLVRDLSATGYYTTPEGMKDLGYVGNVALPEFPGPPPEVLRRLGLA